MLLNCGVGEESWESLGLQGDPTSPSERKSVLNIHCKGWCWSWNSNTLATWCKELTHLKRPCWERWKVGGEGDERMRWLDGITDSMDMSLSKLRSWWWTGKPGVLQSTGSQSWTRLSDWTEPTHVKWLLQNFLSYILKIQSYFCFSSTSNCFFWNDHF